MLMLMAQTTWNVVYVGHTRTTNRYKYSYSSSICITLFENYTHGNHFAVRGLHYVRVFIFFMLDCTHGTTLEMLAVTAPDDVNANVLV